MYTQKELHRWYFTGKYPKTFEWAIFCANRQKVLSKKNSFVRKNVMIWQKNGAIKNVRHSGKRERRLTKKSKKKWRRRRGRSQKKWCHSLKNTRFCKWPTFWMTPMMLTYFAVFFMSVFVDDVISFLWNK